MECLFAYYRDMFTNFDGNIFELFSNFYNLKLLPVDAWLESYFINKVEKDNRSSIHFRKQGNECYARKDLMKSLEYYSKSVCSATPGSREYSLALANRSAVTFEMKDYENCLKDIELCLKAEYPLDLKPKVYFRKAECYLAINQKESFQKCMSELSEFLSSNVIHDKDKYLQKLERIRKVKTRLADIELSEIELPEFEEGENANFAYASSKIKMSYAKSKGRHVVANKKIHKGDILFIEKAFVFAPVFRADGDLHPFKCYNCLRDVISSIPCEYCTICVYCNERCRASSWDECHRWECKGMQGGIWYNSGIAFPAFKAVLKGLKSGFKIIKGDYKEDLKKFGDKIDNYPYFNRLISNIYKTNAADYVVMAGIVVRYLEKYTNFFNWYLEQKTCVKRDLRELVNYIGGLITKHIAQLSSNSSIIEHWSYSSDDLLFPDVVTPIACGMFPSVSIMNHSCKPNITNFFIRDTIVVKALEDIAENEEILNCYGIDYRSMSKTRRQLTCKGLYYFDCKCEICLDPSKELNALDGYTCPTCKGMVPELRDTSMSFCVNCGEKCSLEPFRKINDYAQAFLENENKNQIDVLMRCIKIRTDILYKYHKNFGELYYKLYSYYVEHGDAENMFKYFHLWLNNEKARKGDSCRSIGTKLYEAALAILHCLQNSNPKNCTNLKGFLQNVECMIKEAKVVLNLYYPAHITNKLSKKIQFISNK